MISFGLRWRLARGASNVAHQVVIGVAATAIASVLLPLGSQKPASAPEPKVTLRIEPEVQPSSVSRPLVQQASVVVDVEPAAAVETRILKPASHKPKRLVAMLPPVRPRDAPELVAAAPEPVAEASVAASGWDWLAESRAAVDVTASALDASKRWALEREGWASRAASGVTAVLSQSVRFGP